MVTETPQGQNPEKREWRLIRRDLMPHTEFDRFTASARDVLNHAREIAAVSRQTYIGTEHLLGAVVDVEDSISRVVLEDIGVSPEMVTEALARLITRGEVEVPTPDLSAMTPRAKKIIENAVEESRRMGDTYIGSHHVLIGISREGEGIGAGYLEALGVTTQILRSTVEQQIAAIQKSASRP